MTTHLKMISRTKRMAMVGLLLGMPLLPLTACSDGGDGRDGRDSEEQNRDRNEDDDGGGAY